MVDKPKYEYSFNFFTPLKILPIKYLNLILIYVSFSIQIWFAIPDTKELHDMVAFHLETFWDQFSRVEFAMQLLTIQSDSD